MEVGYRDCCAQEKAQPPPFLALLVFTQQSYCRSAGFRRPSVNKGFSETATWIGTKFYGKLPIHNISRPFFILFFFSNFSIFKFLPFFFSFSLTWDPMGAKISKRYSSLSFHSISTKFYCKYVGQEGMGIQGVTVFANLSKFKNFMAQSHT